MKTVCQENMCAGCMACIDACSKGAITIEDCTSAYNAVIDSKKCINCNACHRVCQANHQPSFRPTIYWKQGWATESTVRESSSSGGFAAALEQAFLRSGGIVYSCVFKDGEFRFECVDREEDVSRFAGSKYVKSNPSGIYKEIKKKLRDGKKVLFVGLPCQAAAVLKFCGENDNLYTVDLICHGSPSPKLLELFLHDYKLRLRDLSSICFRTKTVYQLKPNEKALTAAHIMDFYTMTFLNGTTYTENCYSCKYARQERVTDITLGDSWGSNLPINEQKRGISLLLAQTEKGRQLAELSPLQLLEVDLNTAIANNHQLCRPSAKHAAREKYFQQIRRGKGFRSAAIMCFPKQHIKNIIKRILIKLKWFPRS